MKNRVICLLACMLVTAFHLSCSLQETSTSGDDNVQTENCVIDPEILDFGGVVVGEYADLSVRISLKQSGLDTISTDCTSFSFVDPVTGEPSDTLFTDNLAWEYNSTSAAYVADIEIRFAPLTTGEKSCNFTFSHTWGETVHLCPVLIAEGVGIIDCGFNPEYLDFPTTIVGGYMELSVTLAVVAWPPDNPTIACDDFRFIDPISLQPTATLDFSDPGFPYDYNQTTGIYSTELTIRFEPLTPGTKDCTINIVKTGESAYECPTLSLHGLAVESSGEWRWFDPVTTKDLKDVYGNVTEVYACGDLGTIVRHTHGDADFTVWMEEDFDEIPLDAIWVDAASEPNVVWVGGGEVDYGVTYGKLYQNNDGSTSWTFVDFSWMLDMISAIWGTGPCDKYFGGPAVSGMMPTLYHWDCSELTSENLGLGYEKVTGIHGTMSANVWATMDFNMYNVYHYDGEAWELRREEWMNQPCYDVWAAPGGNQAWAVGANGAIYHWMGSAWEDQSISGETRTIYGIWGFSVVDIYAVGADWLFYHYNGSVWEEMAIPGIFGSETLYAVWGISPPKRIYAVGTNGTTLMHSPTPEFAIER